MTDPNDTALRRLARDEDRGAKLDAAARRIATELATELLADQQRLYDLVMDYEADIWPYLARIMAAVGEYVTNNHEGAAAMARIHAMIQAKALRQMLMDVARRDVLARAYELAREEQWMGGNND